MGILISKIAIFGFFGGAIISALVCGFFLTILEINNTLKKIIKLNNFKDEKNVVFDFEQNEIANEIVGLLQ